MPGAANLPPAVPPGITVLHADAHVLILDKPSGLLSVPGRGADKADCLSARVVQRFADALVVHRLDMATSGLMMMARGLAAQQALNRLFSTRAVHKRYQAIVAGDCRVHGSGWHSIDLPIAVDWPRRPLRIIDTGLGKPSHTRWQCLSFDPVRNCSRLELEPLTGRSHQLRVHLQAIGHPIVGDPLYADEAVAARSERLLLHACELGFDHPFPAPGQAAWQHMVRPDDFGNAWP